MKNSEIIEAIKNLPVKIPYPIKAPNTRIIKYYLPDILLQIMSKTTFLPNKTMISERLYCIEHDITDRQMCTICHNKPTRFHSLKQGYNKYCSNACCAKDENWCNRQKISGIKRHQSESVEKKQLTIEHRKHNNLLKYGHTSTVGHGKALENSIKTNRTYTYNRFCQDKRSIPAFTFDEYLEVLKHYNQRYDYPILKWKCLKCNEIYFAPLHNGYHHACYDCFPVDFSISDEEKIIRRFISLNYFGTLIENTKSVIPPLELDIYLPELKLGIEFNGLYWHSIEAKQQPDYHLIKTLECEKRGIRLLHIWEDELLNQPKLEKKLLDIINKTEKFDFTSDQVILCRDIYPIWQTIPGYTFIESIAPEKVEKTYDNRKIYHVYNTGYLRYRKNF